ncbi:MAG: hypothetical protein E2O54_12275 [Gammaproteobacteria bacterium]|nr:MAG: hypothetical protein E2O58_07120 [Gammaproteobacteria bacterium]TDJ38808.1 MAG: hypothetical protein E2O54_12275 [Gammaproteobacteria bacterium]
MTREDRSALLREWLAWSSGRVMSNQTCMDFVDDVIQREPRFATIHVFEILDLLVNAEPERRSA